MASNIKEPRRPLLSGGELLTTKTARPGRVASDKYHPFSVSESHGLLAPQATVLREGVAGLPTKLTARHVLFEATLWPNYLASSYHPIDLLDQTDLYLVGTRNSRATLRTSKREKLDAPTKTLILAGESRDVINFAKLVEAAPSSLDPRWEQIRQFSQIALPSPELLIVRRPALGEGEVLTWESVLSDIGRSPSERESWSREGFEKWRAWIEELGGQVATNYSRRVGGLTFVPIALHGEALNDAARFNLLRAIRPMPQVRPMPGSVLRAAKTPPAPRTGRPRHQDIRIAVFDGGIDASSPYFSSFVTSEDVTPEPSHPLLTQHGTLVTSALLFGPVESDTPLPQPIAPVSHYRVLPAPSAGTGVDTELYWVLDQIVSIVQRDNHQLVNLSLGPDECVEDDGEPTRWTAELDQLAYERDVLFITAVGNNGEEDTALGFDRVQSPGDMVNGIGVGACASNKQGAKLARAPYSARGPGREGQRVQPTVVAFGGIENDEPFVGIDGQGRFRQTAGTSFAAPLVTRATADLLGSLPNDKRRPEIARAFVAHSASRKPRGHKAVDLGHGRCVELFDAVWECAEDTCTVIYDQQLSRGQVVAMRFPLPVDLDAEVEVEIDWTLCFATDVDPTNQADYTANGLDVRFRPHEGIRAVSDPSAPKGAKPILFDSALHQAEIEEAYRRGWTVSETPPAFSRWAAFSSERALRLAGKWETLVRGRVKMAAASLKAPRLDVSYLRRDGGALTSGRQLPRLHVVMIATLRLANGAPLYDRVREQYEILTPLLTIPVRAVAR